LKLRDFEICLLSELAHGRHGFLLGLMKCCVCRLGAPLLVFAITGCLRVRIVAALATAVPVAVAVAVADGAGISDAFGSLKTTRNSWHE